MARERKYSLDEQTDFAKTHSRVMRGHYMTDIDSIQIVDTENKMYHQYTYKKGTPIVRRFIEVKERKSQYIIDVFSGERKPSQQMLVQSNTVAELNQFRKQQGMPLVEYVIVIQDFNAYPYEVWKCDTTFGTGALDFTYQTKVYTDEEYKDYFTTSVV